MNSKVAKAAVVPVRQRTQYTCMSSSLSMCLKANGMGMDEDTVNRVMGAKPMQGASWEQAIAAAQHFGMRATLVSPCPFEQLKRWVTDGIPVMIAWNPEGRPWSHASVVFDVVEDQGVTYVHVADPNIPDPSETVRVVTSNEFFKLWGEKWPDYIVRRPAMAIEREITPDGRQYRMASAHEATSPHKTVTVKVDGPRNPFEKERGTRGWGGGSHQNRTKDVEEGRSRKEKHKKDWRDKEAAGAYDWRPFAKAFAAELRKKAPMPFSIGADVEDNEVTISTLWGMYYFENPRWDDKLVWNIAHTLASKFDLVVERPYRSFRAPDDTIIEISVVAEQWPNPKHRLAADATVDSRDLLHIDAEMAALIKQKFRGNVLEGTPRGGFTLMLDNPESTDVGGGRDDVVDYYFIPDTQVPGGFTTPLRPSGIYGNIRKTLETAFRDRGLRITKQGGMDDQDIWTIIQRKFPDWPLADLQNAVFSTSPYQSGEARKVWKMYHDLKGKRAGRVRWTDMDGRPIEVGTKVEHWPTPEAYSWVAPVVGMDDRERVLLVGDPKHPVEIPYAEVPHKLRVRRYAGYVGNPDGKDIYPKKMDHGVEEPLAGGTDIMRRLQNELLEEQQGNAEWKRPESPKVARWNADTPGTNEASHRLASRWIAKQTKETSR